VFIVVVVVVVLKPMYDNWADIPPHSSPLPPPSSSRTLTRTLTLTLDPSLPDNPIVYASQGFLDMTGFTLDQILGE